MEVYRVEKEDSTRIILGALQYNPNNSIATLILRATSLESSQNESVHTR